MSGPARGGRVLVVAHSPIMNGATIAVLRTLPLLEARGWSFSFWVPEGGDAGDRIRAAGYEVTGRHRPIASGLRAAREPPGLAARAADLVPYLRAFARAVRAARPDVVHGNSLYSFAEALAARRIGFPTVLHLHDMAPASRKGAIARLVARRGVDLSFAVSEACARSYAHRGWSPRVVHGAAPLPAEPASLRADPRPFVVGSVGVVARRKGSDVLVEAARSLAGEDVRFELVGSPTDPLDREWGEAVLARARDAGIRHIAESRDVEGLMRGWDAVAVPSRRDPFPLVVLEAMALGLPVIGAAVDGIPEQLGGGCGILVEPGDPGALAGAIRELAAAPVADRRRLGAAARERVRARFNLERLAAQTEHVYSDAAAAPPKRRVSKSVL